MRDTLGVKKFWLTQSGFKDCFFNPVLNSGCDWSEETSFTFDCCHMLLSICIDVEDL